MYKQLVKHKVMNGKVYNKYKTTNFSFLHLLASFTCGMCFFAVCQQTIFYTTNTSLKKLRGTSNADELDDFLTSKVPAKEELGRAGWTILHRIASKFSKEPDSVEKKNMKQFLSLFATLYPCPDCAKHFREYIAKHPPDIRSNEGITKWMCNAHNEVNKRNNKATFPCKMDDLITRWGACGCDESESITISKILERRRRSREH